MAPGLPSRPRRPLRLRDRPVRADQRVHCPGKPGHGHRAVRLGTAGVLIVDDGASRRNWAAASRLSDAYPHAQMVHLPVHASWL